MASNKWETIEIETKEGTANGIAPVIISASRATDIPAFYPEWLINRLNAGYVKWINPFNRKAQFISFTKARVIVFWTKDVEPIVPYLGKIDERGINYYFSFTLNDYEEEGLEPRVRKLADRINTFKKLSEEIGKDKVIWRFDPLILTDKIDTEALLAKIYKVGNQIANFTKKLVISFADISMYRKVQSNLQQRNINYQEFTVETMNLVAKGLAEINKSWGLEIATCAEDLNLTKYNIKKNKCIDDELMIKAFAHDQELMKFLGYKYDQENLLSEERTLFDLPNKKGLLLVTENKNRLDKSKTNKLKDQGQRESCGCIVSKDIGQYDTCNHQCVYCYANSSPQVVTHNYQSYLKSNKKGESIL